MKKPTLSLIFAFLALQTGHSGCSNSSSKVLAENRSAKQVVSIFQEEHIYFQQGDNKRTVKQYHKLPDLEAFDTVTLSFDLSCPNDRCDWWDRSGELTVLNENGDAFELLRFKTPYRVGASWKVDVSDFLPILHGKKEFSVFIDTWVRPGHAQGDGWLVSAQLEYSQTNRSKKAINVIPVFTPRNERYGNPDKPAMLSKTISTDMEFQSASLITYITGHGQGNSENCAEFCPKSHEISVAGNTLNQVVWRDNCQETITKGPQMGTWRYARAGWCPGDKVDPILFEPTELAKGPWEISWKPEDYVNALDKDYDSNGHTRPYYRVSSYLVLYEDTQQSE